MLDVLADIVFALSLVAAGVLLYAAMRPDTFRVERSVSIRSTPEKIFPLINDLGAFNTWNPFLRKDPATKVTYRGPTSGPGAAHDWDGNANVGRGSVAITEATPPTRVVMALDMLKPMEAHNRVSFTLVPVGDTTTLSWMMAGRQPYLAKLMSVFIDCDKMVGGDFERGLNDLKALVER